MKYEVLFREITQTEIDKEYKRVGRDISSCMCVIVKDAEGNRAEGFLAKKDLKEWGEAYIREHITLKFSEIWKSYSWSINVEPFYELKNGTAGKKRTDEIKIPTYLKGFVKNPKKERLTRMSLCSSTGNELLEIWYYGDLLQVKGAKYPFIVDTDAAPGMVVAKDTSTGEEILIFDGTKHGYDNMFCDTYSAAQIENRPLKRYDIPASKLILELGYSIDYEDEKEEYDFDDDGNVVLIDGTKMTWEDVKQNGFDYIALSFMGNDGKLIQFLDCELA
jgi:hypothetical protein